MTNNNQGNWTPRDEKIATGAALGAAALVSLLNPVYGLVAAGTLAWRAMEANQKGKPSIWSNLDDTDND